MPAALGRESCQNHKRDLAPEKLAGGAIGLHHAAVLIDGEDGIGRVLGDQTVDRFALAVVAMLGKNVVFGIDWNLIIAIGLPMVPNVARVVRSSALAVREMPYIDAARTALMICAVPYRHGAAGSSRLA